MRDKTLQFCRRIEAISSSTTDEECVTLLHELDAYLKTVPEEEKREFVQSGYGEMLCMCCPSEAVKLPPEAYQN